MQHIDSRLLQGVDLLLYNSFKRPVIHKPWQLSAPVLIFKFLDLLIYSFITYSKKEQLWIILQK